MHVFVVKYSTSYGLQCVLSNSEKEKTEFTKITLRNTKATLPFAIISVISNKAFVIDTRVYMNHMKSNNRWCIGTLERGFSNFLLLTASFRILPARMREK